MAEIGVRELKRDLTRILRRIREGHEVVTVTWRGHPIARLVPIPERTEDAESVWAEMDRLSEEISEAWPRGVTAAEAVAEQRRDL